jgi:hypothetical protein
MNWRKKGGGGRARRVGIRKITPVPFVQLRRPGSPDKL